MVTTKLDKSVFYDFGRLLSRNGVYNFVVGGRGIGKTYGAKKLAIKNYLRRGEQFIYVRRYRTELSSSVRTFFNDIAAEFRGYGFRYEHGEFQITRNPDAAKPPWETIGYPAALSQSQAKKSVSYPLVTLIIFDEFIIEKGSIRYMPDEEVVFNNFYSTVDRYQDRVRVLFLANSVSIMNPYTIAYHLEPCGREFMSRHHGFVQCHYPRSADFVNAVSTTRFGQFISNTEYGDYALNNVFHDCSDSLVKRKGGNAAYYVSIVGPHKTYSVWRESQSQGGSIFFVQSKRPSQEILLTFEASTVTEDITLLLPGDDLTHILRSAFRHGRMFFDTATSRNDFVRMMGYR